MSKLHGRENDTVAVETAAPKSEVALREESILAFWQKHDIFNKSLEAPAGAAPVGDYIFYDGPPFATGLPHYGHILASTIKDAVPRFWTMRGYRVPRKWGWDCHGLPLENLIEKKLGLSNKRDIEEYGIKNFNEAARGTVMEYAEDWKQTIPRMGRWADMESDYKTMDSTYTESVWWVFSELHKKGLVFEGYKTMHLCPRCGTTLSNFEVNQGYKDIKDIAVTVKLPLLDERGAVTDTSLLVWTTTPWTLPGNLAAAVNQEFEYVKVKIEGDFLILAKGRLIQLGDVSYEVIETLKGSDLVGKSYQPPFPYLKTQNFDQQNVWKIWHADYVELGDQGTGAVHIAPAYGEDDMVLAQANNIPIVHHVDFEGRFKDFVTDFAGYKVKPKDDDEAGVTHLDTDIEIVKALKQNGTLFKKENITHSYPHCWRDDTPLLNYATTSWFVNVPKIKEALVAANNTVKWVPEHVGQNRFGKWLEGARDWAISRQRYWGAPLPIWKNPKTGEAKIIGSLNELKQYVPKSGNRYFLMRHGESYSNAEHKTNSDRTTDKGLTEKGYKEVQAVIDNLRATGITKIIHSPFSRTTQTAQIVAKELGLSEASCIVDDRIVEIAMGDLEGHPNVDYQKLFQDCTHWCEVRPEGGESWQDVKRRAGAVLYELEETYQNETILIVSHNSPLRMLVATAHGHKMHDGEFDHDKDGVRFGNAEIREADFLPIPHNDYELDFHRPYIDEVTLVDEDGTKLERIPDVFDCWFESGSMPYGQHHYMGENPVEFEGTCFPAQFIAEGLDQTRGWFYSLIVLGTALFEKSPFENVIVNGMIMAEDGKKLSKKLQNYSAPIDLANQVGADSMRLYLLNSPIVRGEDLHFSDKEVLELQRKNIGRLHNVLAMYEMYADGTKAGDNSSHVLDKWIVARLNELIAEVTAGYENYELDKATRPIADFIDDLSVWYLRRSRDRLKDDNVIDKQHALATLRFILRELAKVTAPAMPFYAEYLYRAVRDEDEAESVHLTAWPKGGEVDDGVLTDMVTTRTIVSSALEARTKSGIKVRQPLSLLKVAKEEEVAIEYVEIIKDEVNVKSVKFIEELDGKSSEWVELDTTLTPELLAEGAVREVIRAVQDLRKEQNLVPVDRIILTVHTNEVGQVALKNHQEIFQKTVGASQLEFAETLGTEVVSGEHHFVIAIKPKE